MREAVEFYLSVGLRPMPMYGVRDGRCACGGEGCRPGKHARDEVEESWKEGREFGPQDFLPGDNVALALGPWGGSDDWLVCLDVDGPLDVGEHFGDLPTTLEQASPRGRHLFFTVPAFYPLGNWTDALGTRKQLDMAVDVRFARGRINAAPSVTLFGTYQWGEFREPAPLPEQVIEVIFERRRERGLPIQSTWERGGKRP